MWRFILSSILIVPTAFVSILPLCGAIFRCGCTLAEGLRYCNIHSATEPHCPWCSYGTTAFWTLFTLILLATIVTIWASLRGIGNSLWVGLASGLAGFLVWASVAGLASALYSGYPVFYCLRLD